MTERDWEPTHYPTARCGQVTDHLPHTHRGHPAPYSYSRLTTYWCKGKGGAK